MGLLLTINSTLNSINDISIQTGHINSITDVKFSKNGDICYTSSADKTIKKWDVKSGFLIGTFRGHTQSVRTLDVSLDGHYIVSGSEDFSIKLWDTSTYQVIKTLSGHLRPVEAVAFTPDGHYILSGSLGDDTIRVWDIATGKEIKSVYVGGNKTHKSISFKKDLSIALLRCYDNSIDVWDVIKGERIISFQSPAIESRIPPFEINSIYGTNFCIVPGDKNDIIRINLVTAQLIQTYSGHEATIISIATSDDGATMLSFSEDNTIKQWDVASGSMVSSLSIDLKEVSSVQFSDNKHIAALFNSNGSVRILDIQKKKVVCSIPNTQLAYLSPNNNVVVTIQDDYRQLSFWSIKTGQEVLSTPGQPSSTDYTFISENRSKAAIVTNLYYLSIWDLVKGDLIKTLQSDNRISCSCLSENGLIAYLGTWNGLIELWDIAKGSLITTLSFHKRSILSIDLVPGSKNMISVSRDKAQKWDATTGEMLQSVIFPSGYTPTDALILPDNEMVMTYYEEGGLRLWDINNEKHLPPQLNNFNGKIMAVSHDLSKMVFSDSRNVIMYDAVGKKTLWRNDLSATLKCVSLSLDERSIIVGDSKGMIYVLDVKDGKMMETIYAHEEAIQKIVFTSDGTSFISSGKDGSIKLWDISSGNLLSQYTLFDNDTWICLVNCGYYNCSKNATNYIECSKQNDDSIMSPKLVESFLSTYIK